MESTSVACPSCGTANSRGQKFCGECGSPLPLVCPTCGSPVTPTQKFCGECATPLTPAPVAALASSTPGSQSLGEERRLVTALFCDLVGFTPLCEQLDPEEVREIQADYFTAMSEQISRYGGIVEKYAGDAVLALFGVPIAHEDDAERAVLCALGMQAAFGTVAAEVRRRWQVEPSLRVGVNTGEVVSGTWWASGRQDVDVTGDSVNTAARLQVAADPGGVLVGAETMRLTRRRIRYGPEQPLVLKGKKEPVSAYVVREIRPDFGERWEEAPAVSPLVGRDRELGQIRDAWMRVRDGEGQLLTITGEPGVGKSRLAAETLPRIAAEGVARIIRGRCLSYGQEISLWLVVDLLRNFLGLREQNPLEAVRVRLDTEVRTLFAAEDDGVRAEVRDVVGEALGLPAGGSMVAQAGPQIRRAALLRSLRLLLRTLCDRAPLIVLLEDLHWIDRASEEVLAEVLSDAPGLRLLVLATQRPGWTAPWNAWSWTERVTLRPLRAADAAMLAGAVLGGMPLAPALEHYLAERAGGNPFFVEELLRMLRETGGVVERAGVMDLVPGAAERLPSTLTEVLLARLDRLAAQVRQVAQVASVIGRSFAVRLLGRVMEREQAALELPLVALQQAEIAFPRQGADLEYIFKHVSMREAAYQTLVSRRRQELHRQTAGAIAALYPADEYAELIAYHYARSASHAEAAAWLERAGDRATAIYATESAVAHYQEAIQRLHTLDGEGAALARVEEKAGNALSTAGHYVEALEVLKQAVERYRLQGDMEGAGRATARMGIVHAELGELELGITLVQPMLETLASTGPSAALALLHGALAKLLFRIGNYEAMLHVAEEAAEMARAIGDEQLLGEAEERQAVALAVRGQYEEALRLFRQMIPRLEAAGNLRILWSALNNAAISCEQLGRMDEMRRFLERALKVAECVGNPDNTVFVLSNSGGLHILLGEWAHASDYLQRALSLLGKDRFARSVALLLQVGELALRRGEWTAAAQYLNEALELCRQTSQTEYLVELQELLAELDIWRGHPEEAIRRLDEVEFVDDASPLLFAVLARARLESGDVERAAEAAAEAVRRVHGGDVVYGDQSGYQSDALWVQGMVYSRQARFEEAAAAFREGLALARSVPYPYGEGRILHQVGLLMKQRGESDQARQHLGAALAIFQRLGAAKDRERTEKALQGLT